MASRTYTRAELERVLPPELFDQLSTYLAAIDNERLADSETGWSRGVRRIPHA